MHGAVVVAACPALAATTAAPEAASARPAAAAPAAAAQQGLPPIGAEVPRSMLATNSVLEYQGAVMSVDFRGGIRQRVDVSPNNPLDQVRLRTIGFKVSGQVEGGPALTIEQNDVDVEAKSTLTMTQKFPPRYEERDFLSFSLTIDPPDGGEPVVLETKDDMELIAQLTQYPARGNIYKLVRPVELVDREQPDTVVARLTAFPSKRGGL